MTTDTQRPPAVDPDAEQEVDFGRYWRSIAARWWLPVAGLVVGLIVGYLVSLGTNSTNYKATAQVYLGQPLAPGGSASVIPVSTSLGLVTNYVDAASTIRSVASSVGLKPSRLRNHIEAKPLTGITGAKLGTPAPLMAISVTGSPPAKIARAANVLARMVITKVAPYQEGKIRTLKQQLAYETAQLQAVNDRLASARATQAQVLSDKSISATDKLVSVANLNAVITQAVAQQVGFSEARFNITQQLFLAENIERGRIVSAASAVKSAGPNSRTGAAVGGLIGLIVGILAALLWDPIAARRTTA
jgi:capsular polysaccharide biosynthesis protein